MGLLGSNALYVLYRVVYLWATFSLWHMAGLTLLLAVYGIVWFMLTKAAQPVYAPLKDGGADQWRRRPRPEGRDRVLLGYAVPHGVRAAWHRLSLGLDVARVHDPARHRHLLPVDQGDLPVDL